MQFTTKIPSNGHLPKIGYGDTVLSLGSCFSVEIADRLSELKYRVLQNPAGITFNPHSISDIIKMIKSGNSLPEESLEYNGMSWCHHLFHSSFNSTDKLKCHTQINRSLTMARQFITDSSWTIITLGTAFAYVEKNRQMIVNNCHKLPSDNFSKKLLDTKSITTSLEGAISDLRDMSRPDIKILFTVSPVRHIKEGLHENHLSKSHCLLAIDAVCHNNSNAHYFPSYEILLDELRDYRFYKEDMIHPSKQAVDYIFSNFERDVLREEEQEIRDKIRKLNQAKNHVPFQPESEAHQNFLARLEKEVESFNKKYEGLGISLN